MISIVCVGKLKEKYWQDAAAEYLKRLSRFNKTEVIELAEGTVDSESAAIIKKLDDMPKAYAIALDVGGKSLNSEELAKKIADLSLEGKSHIAFIIGGSDGYNDQVRKRVDFRLSFSSFTFPHQLMRVILLEQIYRSCKINAGEKYHK